MNGLEHNKLCTHGGDMLGYLYDEMSASDRETFELHLADCGTCIDDFAELSQSRYPVYEWKQTEFDRLPTPRIVVPCAEPAASWFDKVRAALAFNPGVAFGGVAASLLMLIATGYFFLLRPSDDLAKSVEPSPSPARVAATTSAAVVPNVPDKVETPKPTARPEVVKATAPAKPSTKPVRVKAPTPTPKRNDRVPVYSTFDDDEDDSLRLADIFAEIDTSE